MKPAMKMMIANEARGNRGENGGKNRREQDGIMRYDGGRFEMGGGNMGMTYGGDMRRSMGYKDRSYGMGGDTWGGYPRMEYGGMEAGGMDSPMEEMRRGRRRYKNGRFAPQSRCDPPEYGGEDGGEDMIRAGGYDMPMNNQPQQRRSGMENRIGFRMGEEHRREEPLTFPGQHMSHQEKSRTLDKETAKEWVYGMKNDDGTKGPHWTMEQTEQVRRQKNLDCGPLEFWVAMNAAYSDLSKVAKKYNANSVDYYVDYVKAFWFKDQDAVPHKLAAYYDAIVRK